MLRHRGSSRSKDEPIGDCVRRKLIFAPALYRLPRLCTTIAAPHVACVRTDGGDPAQIDLEDPDEAHERASHAAASARNPKVDRGKVLKQLHADH